MRKRKLQIFISSTYEDLIDHRLSAMEAVLAAGHVPAAMEQFSPGDETAWDKIRRWIDESDAFVLILGGRYGSLEPKSGKSYVELEYDYAVEKGKPFFSLVVERKHHEERVRKTGLSVDEREHPEEYKRFKKKVTERLCRFWSDKKDIQSAVFQKLPECNQDPGLVRWVRADEAASTQVTAELARLSQENRQLRANLSTSKETFDGVTFDEAVRLLREDPVKTDTHFRSLDVDIYPEELVDELEKSPIRHLGDAFEALLHYVPRYTIQLENTYRSEDEPILVLLDQLLSHGLLKREIFSSGNQRTYALAETGQKFKKRLLLTGDREYRSMYLWADDPEQEPEDQITGLA